MGIEPDVAGAASWSGSTMIITPADPLELETEYAVTIAAGIRDLAGNEMTELPPPFEFVTAGRPTVVESEPADGADEVPLDAPIELTLLDAHGHRVGRGPAAPEPGLRPRAALERRAARDRADRSRSSPAATTRSRSTPRRPTSPASRSVSRSASRSGRSPRGSRSRRSFRPTASTGSRRARRSRSSSIGRSTRDSVSGEQLTITPDVAGTLEVVALPDDPPDDDGAGRLLRFTPSGPLPPNTTFEVELATGPATTTGEAWPSR